MSPRSLRLAALPLFLCGLLPLGCAPSGAPSLDDDDVANDDDLGDDDDSSPEWTARVAGRVVTAEGDGVPELPVSLCGVVCLVADTDPAGNYLFEQVPAGPKVIEPAVVPVGDDFAVSVRSWTRFFDFVQVADGDDITLDPITLHRVDGAVGPLSGAQDLQLLPDLRVAFDVGVILDEGPLPAGADDVWLGALAIPQIDWPTDGLDGWTVHAAWGLAIWDLEAEDEFAVTATLPAPLPSGTEVALLVADYNYGFVNGLFFVEEAELSSDGVTLTTPTEAGLDRTTMWLAASR